jgi:hypothetical protein
MEYKKSLDDEIDWKIIDQLHSATVNFSNASLELKKLFIVMVGIAIPTLIKLSGDKLDLSLFITIYVLTSTFWFLDSFTYFYQEKLREKMDGLFKDIKQRNQESTMISEEELGDFTLENTRTSNHRIWRSATNPSIRLYFVFMVLNSLTLILFLSELIK